MHKFDCIKYYFQVPFKLVEILWVSPAVVFVTVRYRVLSLFLSQKKSCSISLLLQYWQACNQRKFVSLSLFLMLEYFCKNSDTLNFLKLCSIKFLLICKNFLGNSTMNIVITVLNKHNHLCHTVPKVVNYQKQACEIKSVTQ